MNAPALLADLAAIGIVLTPDGDRLRVDAPAGTVTPEFRSALAVHKAELISLLSGRNSGEKHPRGCEIPNPAAGDYLPEANFIFSEPDYRPIDDVRPRSIAGPDLGPLAPADGRPWRCRNPYCFHGNRWWMSRWGVVNCLNCKPPWSPGLVVSSGDLSDAPLVEPGPSNQAIGCGPSIGGAGSPVPSPRDAGSDAPEDLVTRAVGWLEGYLLRERAEVGQLIADGVEYGLTEAALRAAVGPAGLRVVERDGVTYWELPY